MLPIPDPPRTPTPPPEEQQQTAGLGLQGIMISPRKSSFDPHALSPMVENFPVGRFGTLASAAPSPANPLSPASTNSKYNPMSVDSAGNPKNGSGEDVRGPFNFQTTTLAKSPIARSVCFITRFSVYTANRTNSRVLANDAVTNTSTAACHTRSFSSPLQEHH